MGKYGANKNEILKISDSQKAYNERVAAYYKNEALYQETLGLSHGANIRYHCHSMRKELL